jgi:hypothetical protein
LAQPPEHGASGRGLIPPGDGLPDGVGRQTNGGAPSAEVADAGAVAQAENSLTRASSNAARPERSPQCEDEMLGAEKSGLIVTASVELFFASGSRLKLSALRYTRARSPIGCAHYFWLTLRRGALFGPLYSTARTRGCASLARRSCSPH